LTCTDVYSSTCEWISRYDYYVQNLLTLAKGQEYPENIVFHGLYNFRIISWSLIVHFSFDHQFEIQVKIHLFSRSRREGRGNIYVSFRCPRYNNDENSLVVFCFIRFIRSSRWNKTKSTNKEEILSLYQTSRVHAIPLFPRWMYVSFSIFFSSKCGVNISHCIRISHIYVCDYAISMLKTIFLPLGSF